jgi:DNA primase
LLDLSLFAGPPVGEHFPGALSPLEQRSLAAEPAEVARQPHGVPQEAFQQRSRYQLQR